MCATLRARNIFTVSLLGKCIVYYPVQHLFRSKVNLTRLPWNVSKQILNISKMEITASLFECLIALIVN